MIEEKYTASSSSQKYCTEIKNQNYSSLDMPGMIQGSKAPGISVKPFCIYNPADCKAAMKQQSTASPSEINTKCNAFAKSSDASHACQEFIREKHTIHNILVDSCNMSESEANDIFNNQLCECNCNRKNCADSKKKLSGGAIAGIVIGSIVFIAIIIYILYKKGKIHPNLNFLHRKYFTTKITMKLKKK